MVISNPSEVPFVSGRQALGINPVMSLITGLEIPVLASSFIRIFVLIVLTEFHELWMNIFAEDFLADLEKYLSQHFIF